MAAEDLREIAQFSSKSVNFATQSECRYLELLRYSEALGIRQSEGTLDDAALLKWLEKV